MSGRQRLTRRVLMRPYRIEREQMARLLECCPGGRTIAMHEPLDGIEFLEESAHHEDPQNGGRP
jgi:hypothetical protein